MKQLILAILFCGLTFGQVKFVSDALDSTSHSQIHSVERNFSFVYITVDLVDSADVITVYTGTNDPDSTSATNETYSQTVVVDLATGDTATTITGDEVAHTYKIVGEKRKNIKLTATTWSDTTAYILEAY